MSNTDMRASLTVTGDLSSLVSEMRKGAGSIDDFRNAATQAAGAAKAVAPALNQSGQAMAGLGAQADKAGLSLAKLPVLSRQAADQALAAAVKTSAGFGQLQRATAGYSTSMAGAVQAGREFSAGTREQVRDMAAAIQEQRIYQAQLDAIRARFNPLFAAQQRYRAELKDIAAAEQMTATSAQEAATVRATAAKNLQAAESGRPTYANGAANNAYFAAQANDVAMMSLMGQNPLMMAIQQGPQISQQLNMMGGGVGALKALGTGFLSILNPMSLATIGMVAFTGVAIQGLKKLLPETLTFDQAVDALSKAVTAYDTHLKIARSSTADLAAQFGSADLAAKQFATTLSQLDRLDAMEASGKAISALMRENGLLRDEQPTGPGSTGQLYGPLASKFGLSRGLLQNTDTARRNRSLIAGVEAGVTDLNDAPDIEARIAAVQRLEAAWKAAAEADGKWSKDEKSGLREILALADELAKFQGLDENAAGTAAAGELTAELERQAAVQNQIAKYGQDSVQVRQLELVQTKMATAEKLRDLGFDSQSQQFRQAMAAIDAKAAAEAQAERDARARAHQDQIAGFDRQLQLLGATTAEQLRINALAEAEIDIRDRNLAGADAMLERMRAIARAAAEAGLERARAVRDLQANIQADQFDARIGLARDPLTRADLEAQKAYAAAVADGEYADLAAADAARIRAKAINDAMVSARVQAADMLDEVRIRQDVNAQVAAGTLAAADANRVIQQELQLRPLVAAAARAEGAEKQALTNTITALRLAYEAQAAEERRQGQNDYLRTMAERVQQAKLELALTGQTAEARARILAAVQAEREIRAQGLSGAEADWVRDQARQVTDLNRQIERQADAWKSVQSAGEQSIDAVLDKLRGGDVTGAFEELANEISGTLFDLTVRNPLKNATLGTNLGTLSDVGGLSGLWGRLTSKTPPLDEAGIINAASQQVQAMQIAASTVTITTTGLNLGGLANINGAPMTGLGGGVGGFGGGSVQLGGGNVPSQIWSYFAGKGLAPHQIAAIVGHAKVESGFDPAAIGDNGNATGLFQHNGPRMRGLLNAIGGRGNLGDINAQLDYVWREFQGAENGAFKRLLAAPDLKSATWAMQGFERPADYDANVFGSGMHFDKRLAGAEAAMTTFAQAAQTATADLGTFGGGLDGLGSALAQALNGAAGGAGGDWMGALVNIGARAFGVPGFAGGGDHLGGLRVVGERGPELEFTGPSRIVNAELTRQLMGARNAQPANSPVAVDARPVINITNRSGAAIDGEVQERTDERGQRQYDLVLSDAVGAGLSKRGGRAGRELRSGYGLSPVTRRRG